MRRLVRLLGTLMIVSGIACVGWAVLVWRWEDPFTSLYTAYEQRTLESGLDDQFADYRGRRNSLTTDRTSLAAVARTYRRSSERGDGIGFLVVPRLNLRMVVVYGTDTASLKRGPGLDPRTFFPGQGRLVYIAGHRTTYSAPFSRIDTMRRGDLILVEMPYGTFVYRVTRNRIVEADDVWVLRGRDREEVALQACHPRFFASHRWITYGRLEKVERPEPRGGEASG